jgi:hypothetical protein
MCIAFGTELNSSINHAEVLVLGDGRQGDGFEESGGRCFSQIAKNFCSELASTAEKPWAFQASRISSGAHEKDDAVRRFRVGLSSKADSRHIRIAISKNSCVKNRVRRRRGSRRSSRPRKRGVEDGCNQDRGDDKRGEGHHSSSPICVGPSVRLSKSPSGRAALKR